jgi:hypothetical protein
MNFHLYVCYVFSALFIFDMKYGLKLAPWDLERTMPDEATAILNQLTAINKNDSCTVALWTDYRHLGEAEQVLLDSQYNKDVGPVFWYKENQNYEGASDRFTTSVEVFMIGRKKSTKDKSLNICHMSHNPMKRHNIISGPAMTGYLTDAKGEKINMHEKPGYLAQWMGKTFTNKGDWAMVVGAGAGGDVFGLLENGNNVIAIERDGKQVKALEAHLVTYDTRKEIKAIAAAKNIKQLQVKLSKDDKEELGNGCPNCGCSARSVKRLECYACNTGMCAQCDTNRAKDGKSMCGAACLKTHELYAWPHAEENTNRLHRAEDGPRVEETASEPLLVTKKTEMLSSQPPKSDATTLEDATAAPEKPEKEVAAGTPPLASPARKRPGNDEDNPSPNKKAKAA